MLDAFLVDIKNQKTKGDQIKLCFSFVDMKTNQSIGFYGLSHSQVHDDLGSAFFITIDDLYINQHGIDAKWDDALYLHLTDVVSAALSDVKTKLTGPQSLEVFVAVPEHPEVEELLKVVINSVCIDLSLTDYLAI
jgi:hypothetical protein